MNDVRIIERPAFQIIGKQTFISGPDNEQFGRFWEQCKAEGLLKVFDGIKQTNGQWAGPQTGAAVLGVSRVEQDPSNRAFHYMIAIEGTAELASEGMEVYEVPATTWAVFPCRGELPMAIVHAEIYAFSQWLPNSGYQHALAPEMEVYPASGEPDYYEFWLPVVKK